jgi:hypothetical protein
MVWQRLSLVVSRCILASIARACNSHRIGDGIVFNDCRECRCSGADYPEKCGMDPAQSSSIVLTTITDIAGFMSFLVIALLLSDMLPRG